VFLTIIGRPCDKGAEAGGLGPLATDSHRKNIGERAWALPSQDVNNAHQYARSDHLALICPEPS
jgi:hypothetical protein